jgi:hypothetical protein
MAVVAVLFEKRLELAQRALCTKGLEGDQRGEGEEVTR